MTDQPTTAANSDDKPKTDPALFARRAMVWVLSALAAGTTCALVIKFFLKTELTATVPISFVEIPLLPLAAFPLTLFFMIWFDYFLKTRIVND